MFLSPIHYVIICEFRIIEQVFEQSFYPNIVRLFLKLQSFNIIKVLLKLVYHVNYIVLGRPSHKLLTEIEAFFSLILSYLKLADSPSSILSQGSVPFKKYTSK